MNRIYIVYIFLTLYYLVGCNIIKHPDEVEFNFFADSSFISPNSHCNKPIKFHNNLPQHVAGYIDIKSGSTIKGRYFYTLIENRYKKADLPLILWSNGGPGRSSLEGLFFGNGPYSIQDDLSLCWSKYGWDQFNDVLFVDHPLDVGFSYSLTNNTDYSEYTVPEDMLGFLYSFYERHPELISSDFYMSGLSFAGHFLPSIGDAILKGNKEKKGVYINLKGMDLDNPFVSTTYLYKSVPEYAYEQDIITKEVADEMLKAWPSCDQALKEHCDYTDENIDKKICLEYRTNECFNKLYMPVFTYKPDLYAADIRGECYNDRCKNLDLMTSFLNLDNVKDRLNVSTDIEWIITNRKIFNELSWLFGTEFSPFIEELLEAGLKITVDVGTYDLSINEIGTTYWMENLDWKYRTEWNEIEIKNYTIKNNVVGKIKSAFNLTFALVDDAAHWIVQDQPDVALSLLLNLIYDKI